MNLRPTRRTFLQTGALLVSHALLKNRVFGAIAPRAFDIPLPVPPVLKPTRSDSTTDYYEITQREAWAECLPGVRTKIWGYEGLFPGPTIKARTKRVTKIQQTNRLSVPTVVHLHGGITESASDGFPADVSLPGAVRTYVYSNGGQGRTLWYHDHAMDHTGRNVYMGLAGMYLLEDEESANLPLPRDSYDVPLIIQVRQISQDGELSYNPRGMGEIANTILVNGAAWPRMEVARRKYRFRILNASNATALQLRLSSDRPFLQIATEGGLLPAPLSTETIPLAMAERVEVVIDFSEYPLGARIILENLAGSGDLAQIMRFDVVHNERDDSSVPTQLSHQDAISEHSAVTTRQFVFSGKVQVESPALQWTINGKQFDPNQSLAKPRWGDVEIWEFINDPSGMLSDLHPVHVHDVRFQILDRNRGLPNSTERGWKDTVSLGRGERVRVIMRFDGYKGKFVLHCHNLDHEDRSMMARFDVI